MDLNGIEIVISKYVPDGEALLFSDKIILSEKTYKALLKEIKNYKGKEPKNFRLWICELLKKVRSLFK